MWGCAPSGSPNFSLSESTSSSSRTYSYRRPSAPQIDSVLNSTDLEYHCHTYYKCSRKSLASISSFYQPPTGSAAFAPPPTSAPRFENAKGRCSKGWLSMAAEPALRPALSIQLDSDQSAGLLSSFHQMRIAANTHAVGLKLSSIACCRSGWLKIVSL